MTLQDTNFTISWITAFLQNFSPQILEDYYHQLTNFAQAFKKIKFVKNFEVCMLQESWFFTSS